VTFCIAETIQREHLPDYLLRDGRSADPDASEGQGLEFALDALQGAPEVEGASVHGQELFSSLQSVGSWKDLEKKMILDALRQAKGRRSRAAAALGWGRSTLWRKMKALGLDS